MKTDLIERYLYAVTKRMNPKIREDVKNELSGLIDDMLTERCGERTPEEKDIRIILTELGTPQELYAKYDTDGDKCLIGQPYYSTYKYVLKVTLAAVAVGLTIAWVILQSLDPQNWIDAVEQWLENVCNGLVNSFALITVLFAFYERKGIKMESYDLDNLPSVPKKREEISRVDCIFSIGICVVFMALLLTVPQYLAGYWSPDTVIPLFDTQVLKASWYLILIFGSMEITRSTIRLMEGSYNRKVMVSSLVTNVIGAVAAILWLTKPNIVNPEFVIRVQEFLADEDQFVQAIFVNFTDFLLTVILIALAADTAKAVIKYLKK